MSTYRVHLTYYRPSGGPATSAFYTIEALSPGAAIKEAKRQALSSPLRKVASWAKCSAGPYSAEAPPLWSPPAPLQENDVVTIPRSPVTGRIARFRTRDDVVGIIDAHGRELRLTVEQLEAATGRKLAPRGPKVTVEYLNLYPNQYCYGASNPVRTSSYDLSQLVQVKVTRHDGVIVNKEIV